METQAPAQGRITVEGGEFPQELTGSGHPSGETAFRACLLLPMLATCAFSAAIRAERNFMVSASSGVSSMASKTLANRCLPMTFTRRSGVAHTRTRQA